MNMAMKHFEVASFTDAWIETAVMSRLRDAGLVASFTDAWIETRTSNTINNGKSVASFTDAWIETGLNESRRSR